MGKMKERMPIPVLSFKVKTQKDDINALPNSESKMLRCRTFRASSNSALLSIAMKFCP